MQKDNLKNENPTDANNVLCEESLVEIFKNDMLLELSKN